MILLILLPSIGAFIGGLTGFFLWMNTPRKIVRMVDKPNLILVGKTQWCRHNPVGYRTGTCLGDFRIECSYCGYKSGWESRWHFQSNSYELGHVCPSVDDPIKPPVWEEI